MTDVTARPPVAVELTNADGSANVYVTADPSLNRITLEVSAASGADVGLAAGTPVAYESLPTGQSAVYVYFDGLLSNAEIEAMDLAAAGWTSGTFLDPASTLQYLVIAPDVDVALAGGDTLDFSLTNVLVAEQPTSGTATVALAGATGISQDDADLTLFVNLANPPQPHDQVLDVEIGFHEATVYTGQSSELVLHLINKGQQPLVPGGCADWDPRTTPTFQLRVLYGDKAGDLAPLGNAGSISGAIANAYGNAWKPVQPQTQSPERYWQMQPDRDGGGTVLGTDEQATIEFSFSGIEASLPPGLGSAITVTYVSWTGVPGYMDGAVAMPVTKKAGPSIASFSADPAVVPYGATAVQTTLGWCAADADGVTFDVPGVPPSEEFGLCGSGPLESAITAPAGAPLTVTAYKDLDAGPITASATIVLPQVTRIDVPFSGDGLPRCALPPTGHTAYLFGTLGTSCSEIDLVTMEVARVWDIATIVKAPLQVSGVLRACCAADRSRLHVAATASDSARTPWLLEIDPAGPTLLAQVSLGTPPSDTTVVGASLATGPDAKTVYVSTLASIWTGDVQDFAAYQLLVVDLASSAVTATYPWAGIDAGGPIVGVGAGGRVFVDSGFGLGVVETVGGFRVASYLGLASTDQILPCPIGLLTADQRTIYSCGLIITANDTTQEVADVVVAVVHIDPASGALSLARQIPLGLQMRIMDDVLTSALTQFTGGITALSRDEKTLYLVMLANSIGVVTVPSGIAEVWPCTQEDFAASPLGTGLQPDVVYAMQPDALSAITLTPRPEPA